MKRLFAAMLLAVSLSACTIVIGSEQVKVERASEFIEPTLVDLKEGK